MKKDKRWFSIIIVGILVLVGLGVFYYANHGKIGQGDSNQSQTSSKGKPENRALELNAQHRLMGENFQFLVFLTNLF